MRKSTPFRNLQRSIHAKREGRIAPFFHGRSAPRTKTLARFIRGRSPLGFQHLPAPYQTLFWYRGSVRALRYVISGKFLTGSIISTSSLQTKNIAKALAQTLLETQPTKGARVFALVGELGSGKTTFAQGFAKGLGVKEKILSPTFIVMKKFTLSYDRVPSRMTGQNSKFQNFYHIDCYRLENPEELLKLGWKEIVSDPRNIVLVEWAERVKPLLPRDSLWLTLRHKDQKQRILTLHTKKFNAT